MAGEGDAIGKGVRDVGKNGEFDRGAV